tara:strand:+ start:50 stop:247 length:198 start_codon:yes stop_codon:yes gene_type:complete
MSPRQVLKNTAITAFMNPKITPPNKRILEIPSPKRSLANRPKAIAIILPIPNFIKGVIPFLLSLK